MSLPSSMILRRCLARRGAALAKPGAIYQNGRSPLIARHILGSVRHQSLSQSPGSDMVNFPGAVNSKFSTKLEFSDPEALPAMNTYRVIDADGNMADRNRPEPDMSKEEMIKLYKDMVTVNIMDLIMSDAQRQGRLSFYMSSAGEEGIMVGSASGLTLDDVIYAQYREHGVLQQRGFTLKNFMSQLFSNKNDSGKGRNMPVHYGSGELKVHAISSCLATQIPQASGGAYALKMLAMQDPSIKPAVTAAYFGEGAASEGDFHAALNIAATRSCPAIFICRNNGYAISTATLDQYRGDGVASRGVGYGVSTIRVDGNDIFAMREVTQEARRLALSDKCRPVLIEAMSYRIGHHSTSDDSSAYREKLEVEDWKRRDNPIIRLRKYMERLGYWDEETEKEARSQLRKDILKAFAEAEKEKKPPIKEMWTDVYEELSEESWAQIDAMKDIMDRYPDEYDLSNYEGGKESLAR